MGLNAIIDLLLNSAQFDSALNKSEQRIKGFAREAEKAGKIAGKIGHGLSLANIAGLDKLAQSSKMARAGIEGLTGAMLLLGAVPLPIAIGVAAVGALAAFALNARNAGEEAEKLHQRIVALTQSAEDARAATMNAAKADLQAQIAAAEKNIALFEKMNGSLAIGGTDTGPQIAAQRKALLLLQADYITLTEKFNADKATKEREAAEKLAAERIQAEKKYTTALEQEQERRRQAMTFFTDWQYDQMQADEKARDERSADIMSALQADLDDAIASTNKWMEESSVYADQAARNMQTAFATFLFDPFKDGLDGLLVNFLQVIQRMIAEVAAAEIFKALGFAGAGNPLSGALAGLFGGKRAAGGPVSAGKAYLVGEKGPEMFVPGTSGGIVPNGAGGASIVVNIDARNATDPAAILGAGQILRRQLQGDMATFIRRGHFPGG